MAAIFLATASTSLGDEVLVSSPSCGLLSSQTTDLSGIQNILLPYWVKSLQDSASYVRSCYGIIATGDTCHDCSTYARSRLPSEQNTDASCPFSSSMCMAPAFQLDTGLMSSDQKFGMNARPRDRVDFRKVTTCAPIEVDNFSQIEEGSSQLTNYTAQSDLPELQHVKLYYGESVYMSTNGTKTLNYTYRYLTFLQSFDNLEGGNFNDYFEHCLE